MSAAYERRVLVLSDDYQFTVEVCANDPSIWTPNVLRSSCGGLGLKNRQKPCTEGYLSSELGVACRSQIIDLDRYRGSGQAEVTSPDFSVTSVPLSKLKVHPLTLFPLLAQWFALLSNCVLGSRAQPDVPLHPL